MVLLSIFSYKFNEIIPFDKWKTTVLSKIKSLIPEEGGASTNKAAPNEEEV